MQRRARYARQKRARQDAVRAPTRGWNARDALDAMEPGYAIKLDNWFPRDSDVATRGGYVEHCDTTETTLIETLTSLETGTISQLIAGSAGKLINVTTATPATIGSGFTEDTWQTTQFASRVFLVNGTDAPQDWDGSTLTATAWTGPTIANLIVPYAYKNRLYFIEKNTLKIWYGGLDAVTGAVTAFDLAGAGNFGGRLVGIASLSQDTGDGPDDMLVLFTSTGDIIVYRGTDPGAADWALVGRFRSSPPLGYRAVVGYSSDVIFMTRLGYLSVARIMSLGASQGAISDLIRGEAVAAAQRYEANAGWEATFYPGSQMLLFNIPRSNGSYDQHVMNTGTGAWTRFRKVNGYTFHVWAGDLYFGGANGKVYQGDTGQTDNGNAIVCDGQLAWTYLGAPGAIKFFGLMKPIFTTSKTPPAVAVAISVDFDPQIKSSSANFEIKPGVGIWDTSIWDQGIWGSGPEVHADWVSIGAVGSAMSLTIRVACNAYYEWKSCQVTYEMGGGF